MFPINVLHYMKFIGLFLLLLGLIFGVVASVAVPTISASTPHADLKSATPIKDLESVTRFSILSKTCLLTGGFLLVGGCVSTPPH